MGRANPTFSDADLLRFFVKNLTRAEQFNVKAVFHYMERSSTIEDQIYVNLFGSIVGIIPVLGDAIDIAFELKEIADDILLTNSLFLVTDELARRSGLPLREIQSIWVTPSETTPDSPAPGIGEGE